ncbi:MAG TPA: ankyrin repeat domain-containing protein [Vicinamibacterales bacterium]|nr:ankyrin repeat domain-containing protein [Vicinamibacterales bacterium]
MPPVASAVSTAVRAMDLRALERALAPRGAKIPAGAIVDAGRLAWKPGLALLVKHGADLNACAKNYRALHALMQEKPHAGGSSTPKRVACLQWLLARGADPDLLGAWPLARAPIVAAFQGEREYLRVLRDGRGKPDVFVAAAAGDLARVKALLQQDPLLATARDQGHLTALQCAAGSRLGAKDKKTAANLVEIARVLIAAGADVHATTRSWGHDVSAASFAVRAGQIDMLRLLLEHGLDPTSAIAPAAWDAHDDMLDLLIARGGDLDRAVEHGRPVLNDLVRWGQFRQARGLLARGASPNVADEQGWTAMQQAASRGNEAMIRDLIAAGGDVTRTDRIGKTPHDVARFKRMLKIARLLATPVA